VVNVNIIDVNDVTITGLSIASQSSSLDLGETITPVPSAGGVAVLMRAAGGAVIVITWNKLWPNCKSQSSRANSDDQHCQPHLEQQLPDTART
jgi:hypothetical protein